MEYVALTAVASPARAAAAADEWTTMPGGVDWEHLRCLADWHQGEPLLWRSLSRFPAWAPEVWERVETAYVEAARNLNLPELTRVLQALDVAGVDAILLEGAALIQTVCPDPDVAASSFVRHLKGEAPTPA